MDAVKQSSLLEEFILFEKMNEHEQVLFCNDKATGLRAIIAIHDTTLGPALGGCRMYPYSSVEEALEDVLRLAKGMTYKCAAADVDFGGGKAVIIGDPTKDKSPELFRAFGQFVDSLNGRFITGTDMGTTMDDFIHAAKETPYIAGLPEAYGGGGDTSIPTAKGVLYGIQATNKMLFGTEQLGRFTYAVQGLGKVGYKVALGLLKEGANVIVTDIDERNVLNLKEEARNLSGSITYVEPDEIYRQKAHLFVPCAFGGVINDKTIDELQVKGIAGSANNQLLEERHGKILAEKGILYAPDYIINSGGLISVSDEVYGANKERVMLKTKSIYRILLDIYESAKVNGETTVEAANQVCERVIEARKERNSFYSQAKRPKWKFQFD